MKKHLKSLATLAALGLVSMVAAAPAQAQERGKARGTANRLTSGTSFANEAAEGGMAEVEFGKLAQGNAKNQAVKEFGDRMVRDHTHMNDELKQIASKDGITLPTSMSAKQQATMDRLQKLQGAQFDRAYMQDMVLDHKKDIAAFKRESENDTNPDLKAFAAKNLPVLEEHLRLAEHAQSQVKATGK